MLDLSFTTGDPLLLTMRVVSVTLCVFFVAVASVFLRKARCRWLLLPPSPFPFRRLLLRLAAVYDCPRFPLPVLARSPSSSSAVFASLLGFPFLVPARFALFRVGGGVAPKGSAVFLVSWLRYCFMFVGALLEPGRVCKEAGFTQGPTWCAGGTAMLGAVSCACHL